MMKATGIVRKIDELGRIVLPIELRRVMGIAEKDSLEIYVADSTIVLKKYHPTCSFCNSDGALTYHKDKGICSDCVTAISST